MVIKKNLFLALCISTLYLNFSKPYQLPPNGSTVAIKVWNQYISYAIPESQSENGALKIIAARGTSASDPSCQFILTVVDEELGSFRLKTLDGNSYVENLAIAIGIDLTATATTPGVTLFYDSDGHICGPIDPTLETVWDQWLNLSNATISTHPDFSGWTEQALAYWIIISPCLLKNNTTTEGIFVPAPITNAATFTFEVIT